MSEKVKKKMPIWIILVIISVVIIFLSLIMGVIYLFSTMEEYDFSSEFRVEKNGEVVLVDEGIVIKNDIKGYYDERNNRYIIQGYLENNSNETYNSISITYLVYDKDGTLLGNAYAYLDQLRKHGTWKFKAAYSDVDSEEVSKFEIIAVNAY